MSDQPNEPKTAQVTPAEVQSILKNFKSAISDDEMDMLVKAVTEGENYDLTPQQMIQLYNDKIESCKYQIAALGIDHKYNVATSQTSANENIRTRIQEFIRLIEYYRTEQAKLRGTVKQGFNALIEGATRK